ncbi:MAG: hypothetical protein OER43_17395 [Gammaproteobacteria bacterium]|nr:hypothetical protein [Gammaproteobacteria bacterium]MDH3413785.1 hypothetical protein [Gammaproteobacteria bacterium]
MYKFPIVLILTFVAGFSLAMLLNFLGKSPSEAPLAKMSDNSSRESMGNKSKTALPNELNFLPHDDRLRNPGEEGQSERKTESDSRRNPSEYLLKYPPPHVADPKFFGPKPDHELQKLRKEALDNFVITLREAGLPEHDIQAAISKYKHEIENPSSSEFARSDEERPAMPQEPHPSETIGKSIHR